MPGPRGYITVAEAENIAMKIFQEYERTVVQPRHEETQKTLNEIQKTQWIGYGVIIAVTFFIKLLWK
jgi:hypothetical protein